MKNIFISPSILSANFGNLKNEIKMLNYSKCDSIHVDIMDGLFVPNISFGYIVVDVIEKYSKKPMDIHLMVYDSEKYINKLKNYNITYIIIHYESSNNLFYLFSLIKQLNFKIGLAINPHTPIYVLKDVIHFLDLLVLMGVNPGFGNQEIITTTYSKISEAKKLIKKNNLSTLIEIDGGVNIDNYTKILDYGVNVLVSGSLIFSASNPVTMIQTMKTYYLR